MTLRLTVKKLILVYEKEQIYRQPDFGNFKGV